MIDTAAVLSDFFHTDDEASMGSPPPPATARQLSDRSLGDNIRRLRKSALMSQAELARHAGISTATLSVWERGRRTGAQQYLTIFAQALGVSVEQLSIPLQDDDTKPDTETASPARMIGERIRLLRKALAMSRADLAKNVGISVVALGFWETGRPGDAQKHLPKIAQYLGVSVETLLTGNCHESTQETLSQDELVMLQLYRRLGNAQKIHAQRWIEKLT